MYHVDAGAGAGAYVNVFHENVEEGVVAIAQALDLVH